MSGSAAMKALMGAFGVVVGLVFCVVSAAAVLVALGLPADGRADDPPPAASPRPTELVVGLSLTDPVLQAGVVHEGRVILARGLEVEIARALARRLGIPRVRFVHVSPAPRLLAASGRPWHLGIASISAAAAADAELSEPYLPADQVVVLRRGVPVPAGLAELRRMVTCAVRGSEGARTLTSIVRPSAGPLLPVSATRLLQLVQRGACDAALVEGNGAGRFVAGTGALLGPVSARVATGGGYVVAVSRAGPVDVDEVNRAIARMRADGTLHRLARSWLGIDPARLRRLG